MITAGVVFLALMLVLPMAAGLIAAFSGDDRRGEAIVVDDTTTTTPATNTTDTTPPGLVIHTRLRYSDFIKILTVCQ